MLIYGIRCSPDDLSNLPSTTVADYYLDYGLLVFPGYSKPTTIQAHGSLTPRFWAEVNQILSNPKKVHVLEHEHPYITESEDSAVKYLEDQGHPPPEWYYVPHLVINS